ncbi:MAG: hypothetical protein JO276_04235 [Sphingomonadaceae bacterium]|nr:hypothetical protein [Sphingomonadaceae bacterium]
MATSKPKYREATHPQISANQLAQYLTAGPAARKRIIRDARYIPTVIVARYKLAREAIVKCLCDPLQSPTTIAAEKIKLEQKLAKPGNSSWTKDDLESSVAALNRYAATVGQTQLPKLECAEIPGSVPALVISGLRVKVTPDVIVKQNQGTGQNPKVGAVVTMIAKGVNSTNTRKDQARTAATLIWMFAQKHLANAGDPERKLCFSYDVFDGALIPAPGNYLNRISNIEAACSEILSGWASASPPPDFDG